MMDFLLEQFKELSTIPGSVPKLKEIILQLAVEGRLTADWRKQNPDTEPASVLIDRIKKEKQRLEKEGKIKKQNPLPEITPEEIPFEVPGSWEWVRLGEITNYIQRGKGPIYSEDKKCPVLSQKCVYWDGLHFDNARFISPASIEKYDSIRFLKEGDLLWNSTGTGTIGRMCLFSFKKIPFEIVVVDSHVTVVRLIIINQAFIYRYIQSPFVQNDFESKASGTTNQIELTTKTVKEYPMPLPPLTEQQEIVKRVDRLMELCDRLEEELKRKQMAGEQAWESLAVNV